MAETKDSNIILLDSITTEVFGVMIGRYVSAVALIILLYDCVITLEDEVSPINLPVLQGPFAHCYRCG
jgi:hypothetical protein